jgi:hypothetical protein
VVKIIIKKLNVKYLEVKKVIVSPIVYRIVQLYTGVDMYQSTRGKNSAL